ncbi:MAG TPA: MFS transporter, partial [Pseudolysinimonas sp.]
MSLTSPAARTATARRIPFVLAVLATGIPMFMATLDNLVITNALPVIHADLGATVEELQWFINSYTLVFASLILMTVALGDRLGRRTIFIAGIAIFTLASIAAALSTDPTQLIIARGIQGIGGAGIMPLSLSLLSGAVSEKRRPLAIGIW